MISTVHDLPKKMHVSCSMPWEFIDIVATMRLIETIIGFL